MRNQQTTSISSSSQSRSNEFFSSVIDFNRNRSNESTETANDTIKMTTTTKPINIEPQSLTLALPRLPCTRSFSSGSACGSYNSGGGGGGCSSIYSAEGCGIPISPKKMPMTPPRDAKSPAGSYGSHSYQYSAGAGSLPPSQQHSFLALPRSSAPHSFLFRRSQQQPQLQAQQQQQQVYPSVSSSPYTGCDLSSLFRSSPSSSTAAVTNGDNCYTLQRCNAFDEGDDIYDDDDEEGFCYSDDEDDVYSLSLSRSR